MIDTLRYRIKYSLRAKTLPEINVILGQIWDKKNPIKLPSSVGHSGWFNLQVSIPRLLYGENGILVKTQEELDKALREIQDYLNYLGIEYDWDSRYITRADLSWNFRREFKEVYSSYRYCKPLGIQDPIPITKEGSWIVWGSGRGNIKFKMYDKGKEVNGVKSKEAVTRVELVLGKIALNRIQFLGDGSGNVKDIKIDRCLKVYREYLSKLVPKVYEVDLKSREKVIARYSENCPPIDSKTLLEAYYTNE